MSKLTWRHLLCLVFACAIYYVCILYPQMLNRIHQWNEQQQVQLNMKVHHAYEQTIVQYDQLLLKGNPMQDKWEDMIASMKSLEGKEYEQDDQWLQDLHQQKEEIDQWVDEYQSNTFVDRPHQEQITFMEQLQHHQYDLIQARGEIFKQLREHVDLSEFRRMSEKLVQVNTKLQDLHSKSNHHHHHHVYSPPSS